MAIVCGTPITDSTLKGMPEFIGKEITQADRAKVARNMKESENKLINVTTYVENLKKDYGNGICMLGMIYNATGDDLTYMASNDWHGHIGSKPYPQTIQNGQWGGFLHVHPASMPAGSAGGVVYCGSNAAGLDCAWVVSWSIPFIGNNNAYIEARDAKHYLDQSDYWYWDGVWNAMEKCKLNHTDKWNGCLSTVSCGDSTSPTLQATFTLSHTR